jgi:hypothetical protein
MTEDNQPLVFIHIPKTAGTSLRKLIQENYQADEIFYIYTKKDNYTTLGDLKNLTKTEKQRFKVFIGHVHFDKSLFDGINPLYVTFLRDPVARVISYYNHIMANRDAWINNKISLLKYIETSGDPQLSNQQTKIISGITSGAVTEKHLEHAIENIENRELDFIGLTEKYEEAIDQIAHKYGWFHKEIYKENVTGHNYGAEYYSDQELEKIIEINRLDYQLYEYVCSRSLV